MHSEFQKDRINIHEHVMDLGCELQNRESGRRNTATYAYDEFCEKCGNC